MKTKMKGFSLMCHSSSAVCMSHDYRSVVVPSRRFHRTPVNGTKYVRLADQRASFRGSFPVPNCQEKLPKEPLVTTSPPISHNLFQVVVMRVSIHCQGCAAKVKKHLSKLEGVTSFSVDLENKRVTVMGHVSPSDVLESISKVKKAEFWPC